MLHYVPSDNGLKKRSKTGGFSQKSEKPVSLVFGEPIGQI
jgi:hypothetical protein